MPRAQTGTGVAIMGCFAALGAVGCAAGVATPAAENPKPTASQAFQTPTLADPADVLRQTVLPQALFSRFRPQTANCGRRSSRMHAHPSRENRRALSTSS
jgi:hypothetical protein